MIGRKKKNIYFYIKIHKFKFDHLKKTAF